MVYFSAQDPCAVGNASWTTLPLCMGLSVNENPRNAALIVFSQFIFSTFRMYMCKISTCKIYNMQSPVHNFNMQTLSPTVRCVLSAGSGTFLLPFCRDGGTLFRVPSNNTQFNCPRVLRARERGRDISSHERGAPSVNSFSRRVYCSVGWAGCSCCKDTSVPAF